MYYYIHLFDYLFADASQAEFDGVSEVKLDTSGQSETVNMSLRIILHFSALLMLFL